MHIVQTRHGYGGVECMRGWQWLERQLKASKKGVDAAETIPKGIDVSTHDAKDKNFIQTLCTAYAYFDFYHFIRRRLYVCVCIRKCEDSSARVLDVLKICVLN